MGVPMKLSLKSAKKGVKWEESRSDRTSEATGGPLSACEGSTRVIGRPSLRVVEPRPTTQGRPLAAMRGFPLAILLGLVLWAALAITALAIFEAVGG
jgi:hypothetical protein